MEGEREREKGREKITTIKLVIIDTSLVIVRFLISQRRFLRIRYKSDP